MTQRNLLNRSVTKLMLFQFCTFDCFHTYGSYGSLSLHFTLAFLMKLNQLSIFQYDAETAYIYSPTKPLLMVCKDVIENLRLIRVLLPNRTYFCVQIPRLNTPLLLLHLLVCCLDHQGNLLSPISWHFGLFKICF